jgi:LemA protein
MMLIIAAAVAVALYLWYATVVARRNKVREALSSVDVHLNQRHDLIPNIVSLAARFMDHDRALLTEVTRLREEARKTPATPSEAGKRFALEGELGQRVGHCSSGCSLPGLKSDRPVIEAQQTRADDPDHRFPPLLQCRGESAELAIQIFPVDYRRIAGVTAMPFFEAPAAAREAPTVDGILGPRA